MARLCDVLKIAEIIDAVVEWDPAQCHLSPGNRVKALIINLLVDREALYHVERFYENQDLEVLFGAEQQVRPEDLNDDALGRALDKLFTSGQLKKLFSSIALTAAATHNVPIEGIHVDTTSISVHGAYEGERDLDITFGFSKDHRPDLKQFLIGLTVNRDGLPILAQSLDGNSSDKSWYPRLSRKQKDWTQYKYDLAKNAELKVVNNELITSTKEEALKYLKEMQDVCNP
ncbi:IS1634 family transposase [Neomoorella thermoacetica]|uniref:IS1634 family transposase n=1 Tax=Neomoorella thermoacetica TaxID=1525 RepID=UPI0030D16C51